MHLKVSRKTSCLYCVCIVYAVAMTSHENRSFSLQTFLTVLEFIIKSLIQEKLVNFFLSEGGPNLAHSININLIKKECPNFEEGWVEV